MSNSFLQVKQISTLWSLNFTQLTWKFVPFWYFWLNDFWLEKTLIKFKEFLVFYFLKEKPHLNTIWKLLSFIITPKINADRMGRGINQLHQEIFSKLVNRILYHLKRVYLLILFTTSRNPYPDFLVLNPIPTGFSSRVHCGTLISFKTR